MRVHALRFYYLVAFCALGVYLPFFPRWLEAQGIDGASMGAIAAAFPAMAIIAPPAFGLLADALRLRRALLRVACAGAFAAFSLIAGASALGRPLGALALGLAFAAFAFFRAPMTMIADLMAIEAAQRGAASYGRIRLFGSLGFLLAALAAGRLLDPRAPAAIPAAIAASLLGALVVAFALPSGGSLPPRPAPGQVALLARDPGFRLFLAGGLLQTASYACHDLCLSLHLRDLGAGDTLVGVVWATGVVFEIALMARSDALLTRVPLPALLAVAHASTVIRWLLVAAIKSPIALLLLQPLHAISFGLGWVASMALLKDHAPQGALATAQGLFIACAALGGAAAMPTWGALYRSGGGPTAFVAAAVVAAGACACSLALGRRWRGAALTGASQA